HGGGGPEQPRHRPAPVPLAPHGREPALPDVPEARHHLALAAQLRPAARMIVGRTEELATLQAQLGTGAAVTLSGEPGIGKSALLEALREAASEHVVLATVGVEQEMAFPYAGLDRILRPLLDGLDTLGERERGALETALGLGGEAS